MLRSIFPVRSLVTSARMLWTPIQETAPGDVCQSFFVENTTDKLKLSVKLWKSEKATQRPKNMFVMIHATGFCKEQWIPVIKHMRALGVHDPVVAFDVVCHGDSDTRKGQLDWNHLAQDSIDVINYMKPKVVGNEPSEVGKTNVFLMGHSMGGAICALIDRLDPTVASKMFLIEPIILMPPNERNEDFFLAKMAIKRQANFPSHQAMYERYRPKPPFVTFDDECLRCYVQSGAKEAADGTLVTLKCTPERESEFYCTGSSHDMILHLEKSKTPAMFSGGENTDTYPMEYLQSLRSKWGGPSSFYVFPGASHFVPMEQPRQVAQEALRFFLDSSEPKSRL